MIPQQALTKNSKAGLRLKTLCVSLLITTACSRIPIKDTEICYDAGPDGASCFTTNSETERDIAKPEWDTLRFGWGCMEQEDIGALKATIEKLCKETKLCDKQFKKLSTEFFAKAETIRKRIELRRLKFIDTR